MEQYKTDFSGFVYVRLEGAAIPIVEDGPEIVYMPKAGDHVVVPAGPHSIKPKQFSMLKDGTDVELTVSDIPLSMMQETVRLITERLRKNGSVRIEVEVYESAMKIGKITQFEERHVQKDGYLTYKITFPFRITGSSPLCPHGENQRRCPICKAFKEGSEAGSSTNAAAKPAISRFEGRTVDIDGTKARLNSEGLLVVEMPNFCGTRVPGEYYVFFRLVAVRRRTNLISPTQMHYLPELWAGCPDEDDIYDVLKSGDYAFVIVEKEFWSTSAPLPKERIKYPKNEPAGKVEELTDCSIITTPAGGALITYYVLVGYTDDGRQAVGIEHYRSAPSREAVKDALERYKWRSASAEKRYELARVVEDYK